MLFLLVAKIKASPVRAQQEQTHTREKAQKNNFQIFQ